MKKGFTLIELLIVMVIVAALIAIALPQYKRSVERGRATVGLTALHEAADKINTWYLLNDYVYPTADQFNNLNLELVGVGDATTDLFAAPTYTNTIKGTQISLARDGNSGWNYTLTATLLNGEISGNITCTGGDCEALGLTNL